MKTITTIIFLSLTLYCASTAQAVSIETVSVGNPGNAADTEVMNDGTTGYGAVSYKYNIGKTEVANSQYVEFLNAVAASDPYGLYNSSMDFRSLGGIVRNGSSGSYAYSIKTDAVGQGPGGSDYTFGDKPVTFISWYDSIRFANWLHNGQGSGSTETGAYTLGQLNPQGIPIDGDNITRNLGANWFLPSEDEWYKAAYYDPNSAAYYDYAIGSDTVPDNNLPSSDTGNSANFFDDSSGVGIFTTGNTSYPLTNVSAYVLSDSPYGTFDQGGNMSELTETRIGSTSTRSVRGSDWLGTSFFLAASYRRLNIHPTNDNLPFGFRVASIPEPSSLLLGTMAYMGYLLSIRHPTNRPPLNKLSANNTSVAVCLRHRL